MWLAEGAPEGISLFLPPLDELVQSIIYIGIVAVVVWKYAVPRYLKTLDERAYVIEGGIKRSQEAEEEIARVRAGLEGEKEAARMEAAKVREEARADANAIVAEAKSKASEEARRIQESAQRQITSERQSAEVALRKDVGALATQLAEKIVGESLKDQDLSSRVIDRFLNELEAETAAGKRA
ncbi:MAG: F0F1 ATP synthase subunit B [Bifidobacteriaceae bacterium]|jgi:F-type H+-transporting ATPase subunit b|nr:F0F1 ATP synthase subunit B [Bifidobacteriaceae bacterium]